MIKSLIAVLAVLALSTAVHSFPTQVKAKDGEGSKRNLLQENPVQEAKIINLGDTAIAQEYAVADDEGDDAKGYKSWVISRNVHENECVYLCFDKLKLRDGNTWSDFCDIYQLNREAEDQATIEGTIIQDPPGSIEQYGTPGEWKLTTVEACCGPDEGSSTTQMLPVYVACSDFPGGGMQVIFSSTTVQEGPNDSKVLFIVADTLDKLQGMGAYCPQGHDVIE